MMHSQINSSGPAPADSKPSNWVDKFAPAFSVPWLRLMRADRPIGTWLLLLPCWWGMALGIIVQPNSTSLLRILLMALLFTIGSFVMRGAGCTYNDIADRDFDAKVARTALRPIPAGQVSIRGAFIFLIALCMVGLVVLLQFNRTTILLGIGSLALVAIYPFMKRITWWPQAWLGLTFNWGALMGFTAVTGTVLMPVLMLYGAALFWTLGYDTVYAHQDKEDDALIGVKSTALRLGNNTKPWLAGFYAIVIALFMGIAALLQFSLWGWLSLIPAAAHFVWQTHALDINDAHKCLSIFKSNRNAGFLLLLPLILENVSRMNVVS